MNLAAVIFGLNGPLLDLERIESRHAGPRASGL
jgi:hypothetical protein